MDRTLVQEQFKEIHEIILSKKFKQPRYMESQEFFHKTIQFLIQLPVQQESFKLMKILINFYGICILPFLKPFFGKAGKEDVEKYEAYFQFLASIVREVLDNTQISEFKFLEKYGVGDTKVKQRKKNEEELEFIKYIQKLSRFNENLKQVQCDRQIVKEYQKFVEILKEKYKEKSYFLMVVNHLILDQQELLRKSLIKSEQKIIIDKQKSLNNLNLVGKQKQHNQFLEEENNNEEHFLGQIRREKQLKKNIEEEQINLDSSSLLNDEIQNKNSLCSREYFYQQEEIKEIEDISNSFIQINLPYNSRDIIKLKAIICSFLNCQGGFLFIGIQKDQRKRHIVGNYYSEYQTKEVLKCFRNITETIEPNIQKKQMYTIDFIPIRSENPPYEFIPQKFIIKLAVKHGQRDEIYSFKENNKDYFAFRKNGQIVYKNGRQLVNNVKERIRNLLSMPVPFHHKKSEKTNIQKEKDQNCIQNCKNSKEKIVEISINSMKKQEKMKNEEKVRKTTEKIPQNNFAKKLNSVQEVESIQREHEQICFYISGIHQEQFLKFLKKKNLYNKVKIEGIWNRSESFVLELLQKGLCNHFKDLFLKIEEKRKKVSIRQIRKGIMVNNIEKGKKILSQFRIRHKIEKGCLNLNSIKDSLKAFNCCEDEKLEPEFVILN